MKTQAHPRNLNEKRKPSRQQAELLTMIEEQTASTSTSSEQIWIMIALVLAVLTVGLYWFSDRQNDQPRWSYEAIANDKTTAKSPGDAAISDLTLSDPENRPKPISNQNERLVRRFYDEVVNQQRSTVMDDLFAEDFSYRHSGSTMTRLSTAYAGLQYSIEHVTTGEDLVQVDWSAGGTPLLSFDKRPPTGDPQVWSGHTVWQVVDGKIAQMWAYHTTGP